MRNCILLVCDKKHVDAANFVAWQLSRQGLPNFDVVISSDDQSVGSEVRRDARFLHLDQIDHWKTFTQSERLSYFAYLRLPAIEILSASYDRILYLDLDIFIASPFVGEVFAIDMGGHALAAVRDIQQAFNTRRRVRDHAVNGVAPAPYFNSGVLLIDCAQWQRRDCYRLLVERSRTAVLNRDDQTLLNLVFYRDWLELNPTWNFMENKYTTLWGLYFGARLIHINRYKIWSEGKYSSAFAYAGEFEAYVRLLGHNARPRPREGADHIGRFLNQVFSTLVAFPFLVSKYRRHGNAMTTVSHRTKS